MSVLLNISTVKNQLADEDCMKINCKLQITSLTTTDLHDF